MAKRTCSILGCEALTVGRGLCRKHYTRWSRYGTTDDPQPVAKETCSLPGCGQLVKAHGWCQTHYRRWQRHGDPEKRLRVRRSGTVEERWWARVAKGDSTDCWLWTGALYWTGYGQFPGSMGKTATAHRWGYERYIGPVPADLELDHLCRNRACVRFDHLEPVTHGENVRRSGVVKWLGMACVIEGCQRPVKVHGLCMAHYQRQWRASRR